ncbi:MAG TPA: STAUR_1299 family protein [Myxococcota bacterium]|jgi:hypothetical protein|nr:STAUR_1299 family protein [Myxococcota bacterium]
MTAAALPPSASLQALLEAAYYSVPGPEATPAIAAERGRLFDVYGGGIVYEVVARPGERLADLCRRVAGRLVYFARAKRFKALGTPEITIALFVGDQLHFVPSSAFFFALIASHGLAPDVLADHVDDWAQGALDRADF